MEVEWGAADGARVGGQRMGVEGEGIGRTLRGEYQMGMEEKH